MKIAVLSGKGGTGKTFLSVNLACAADRAAYVDCDVEEPDGRLFLKPEITLTLPVTVTVPEVGENPFDDTAVKAVNLCRSIASYPKSPAGSAVMDVWARLSALLLANQPVQE